MGEFTLYSYSIKLSQYSIFKRKSEGNTCRGRHRIDEHPEQFEPRGAVDSSASMTPDSCAMQKLLE